MTKAEIKQIILEEIYSALKELKSPRMTFNIQKLVDDGIIFVTEPGDGEGGVAKPNWAGDCSVITLLNITPEELKLNPWRKKAINKPLPKCIPYVQDLQSQWNEDKYQQVIDSIKMKGGKLDNYTTY